MVAILFVCLGNICRSPAAEGILRSLAAREYSDVALHIESCGIGSWHVGQLPDERMRHTAKKRGLTLTSRAQQFKPEWFDRFDYILAADHEVINELHQFAKTSEQKSKIHLITAFSPCYKDQEIPDPYYQGEAGFEHVLDMLEDSCAGLLEKIKSKS